MYPPRQEIRGCNRKYELNSHVLNLTTLVFGQSSCAVVAVVKWNCPVTPGIRLPEKQAEFSPLIINAVSLYYNWKEQDMMGARDSITGSASVRRHRSMTVAMRLPPAMAGLTPMCSNAILELEKACSSLLCRRTILRQRPAEVISRC